ncbi:hypothetical protein JTE90_004671 [Oedothorax gibbosus]|uniref:Uncharacterized protein n=1 Tax=Oedothorax gibbosus TaxID=931172 RepID=A0AAV6U8Q0_9ARAC|nr:hypothetical protein JTE90_004671 [Oedothorax gibbosus]
MLGMSQYRPTLQPMFQLSVATVVIILTSLSRKIKFTSEKKVALPSSIVTLHDGRGVDWITNGQSASQIVPAEMYIGVAEVLQKGSINAINTTHFAEWPTPCTPSKSTCSVNYLSMLAGDLTFDQ